MKTIKFMIIVLFSCVLMAAGCKPAGQSNGDQYLTMELEVDGITALNSSSRTDAAGKVTPAFITDEAVANVYVKAFTSSGVQIGSVKALTRDNLNNTWKGSISLTNPTGIVTFLAYAVSSEATGNMHLYSGTRSITNIQDDNSGRLSIIVEGDESGVDPAYQLGGLGPGGGLVYYDAGNYDVGWRYMEAAPVSWSGGAADPLMAWSNVALAIGPSAQEYIIGTGLSNTSAIISQAGHTSSSAKACADLNFNSLSDWFLPSTDELLEMYYILYQNSLGSFSGSYWSSTEVNETIAEGWKFLTNRTGVQSKNSANLNRVRPARRF